MVTLWHPNPELQHTLQLASPLTNPNNSNRNPSVHVSQPMHSHAFGQISHWCLIYLMSVKCRSLDPAPSRRMLQEMSPTWYTRFILKTFLPPLFFVDCQPLNWPTFFMWFFGRFVLLLCSVILLLRTNFQFLICKESNSKLIFRWHL